MSGIFLADPELKLTDQFGLRNQSLTVRPPGLPGLPIPTTLLVDADGIVCWKDQAENYARRSEPGRIRAALDEHLGGDTAPAPA